METIHIDKRQTDASSLVYPIAFVVRTPTAQVTAEVINYHYRGACLKVDASARELLQPGQSNASLDFYLAKQCIKKDIPFSVVWETIASDGLVGVEFSIDAKTFIKRPERFLTNPNLPPTLSAQDPLDPNRLVFARVVNISSGGMLLSMSLVNKHLFPGMTLRKAAITFPGQKAIEVDLQIANTRPSQKKGRFLLGVQIQGNPEEYQRAMKAYLTMLSPADELDERLDKLAEKSLLTKRAKAGLTFEIVSTQKAYEKVLKLRYLGYGAHGKIKPGTTWKDQGEGLSNEGTIIAAYLGGQVVGSMELRFGDGPLPLRILKYTDASSLPGIDIKKTLEVNKLVVHPKAQGNSDIVLGLIQKVHAIIIKQGTCHVLLVATEKLVPFYERIGGERLGITMPHPSLEGVTLHLMAVKRETYAEAKHINPYHWLCIYEANQKHLEGIGFAAKIEFSAFQKLQARLMHALHQRMKKRGKADNGFGDSGPFQPAAVAIGTATLGLAALALTSSTGATAKDPVLAGLAGSLLLVGGWTEHRRRRVVEWRSWKEAELKKQEREKNEKISLMQDELKELDNKYREAKLLESTAKKIQEARDLQGAMAATLDSLLEHFHFDRGFLMLLDEERKALKTAAVAGIAEGLREVWGFKVNVEKKRDNALVLSSVFHTGNPVLIDNVDAHLFQLTEASQALIRKLSTKAFLMVAVPAGEGNWGVLLADRTSSQAEPLRPHDVTVLSRVAQHLGSAIDKLKTLPPPATSTNASGPSTTGELREVVSLFFDIRDFTKITANLHPEAAMTVLNRVLRAATLGVRDAGGRIEKYIGDGLFATWGAVGTEQGQCERAVNSVYRILESLKNVNDSLEQEGLPRVRVGIGVHYGPTIVGDMTAEDRRELTCVGTPVNTAWRLQELCKKVESSLVVSQEVMSRLTLETVKRLTLLENVTVRGATQPMRIGILPNAGLIPQAKEAESSSSN